MGFASCEQQLFLCAITQLGDLYDCLLHLAAANSDTGCSGLT